MKFIIDATCTYKDPNEQKSKLDPFEIEADAIDGFKNDALFDRAVKGIRSELLRLVQTTIGHKRIFSELLQIVDGRGRTTPPVYNSSISNRAA